MILAYLQSLYLSKYNIILSLVYLSIYNGLLFMLGLCQQKSANMSKSRLSVEGPDHPRGPHEGRRQGDQEARPALGGDDNVAAQVGQPGDSANPE